MQQITTIAQALGADVHGDATLRIEGLCGISDNQPDRLSFLSKASQKAAAANSQIPAFITTEALSLANKTCIIHPDPDYAIVLAAQHFVPTRLTYADESAIHPTATVHPSAVISCKVTIGAHVVIGCDVSIGMNTSIAPGVVILDRVKIGAQCVIHANSIIREDSVLGDRVVLQPGVVIGGDGYGFIAREGRHIKIPQLGNVVLEDDVEIGANTTIDRGRFTATRVGRGTKIDNLVMLAHNVQIGADCLLVAQTGISGSTRLGDRVVLGGQVGVIGHLNITDDVTVLGKSAVGKNLLQPGVYAGITARPVRLWRRAMAKLYADSKRDDNSTP